MRLGAASILLEPVLLHNLPRPWHHKWNHDTEQRGCGNNSTNLAAAWVSGQAHCLTCSKAPHHHKDIFYNRFCYHLVVDKITGRFPPVIIRDPLLQVLHIGFIIGIGNDRLKESRFTICQP
jgi:hypothetical protein